MFACVNIVRMCGNSCGLQDCLSTPPNLRGRGEGKGDGGRVQRRLNSSDLISDTVSLGSQYGAWVSLFLGRIFERGKSFQFKVGITYKMR